MGGTLEITARFPEGNVKITNFSSIGEGETVTAGDQPFEGIAAERKGKAAKAEVREIVRTALS
jgi:hypothetical protein